jgi:hypothetical protein
MWCVVLFLPRSAFRISVEIRNYRRGTTKLLKLFFNVLCDEKSIGGGGKYCGDNNAQLGRINVFYHEASGGKCGPCAVLMDLEPGVTNAAR